MSAPWSGCNSSAHRLRHVPGGGLCRYHDRRAAPGALQGRDRSGITHAGSRPLGVPERMAIPRKGVVTPERRQFERQRWFQEAQRYRTGMEVRISVWTRRGRLGRCCDPGKRGVDRWIGRDILNEDLSTIARSMASRAQPRTARPRCSPARSPRRHTVRTLT